jgi:aminoglycoside phosphotransferase (APT) family kinase protein
MSAEVLEALERGGFLAGGAAVRLEPLTGGVSSDVYRLETRDGVFCVKRALPRLRVAADWRAPVERSHYEVEWLRAARPFAGGAVPEVLYEDRAAHLFVMTFFPPEAHSVWKSDLAAGRVDIDFAARVGRLLAGLHGGAAGDEGLARTFDTTPLFEDLRLAPFFRHAALAHPDLAERLGGLADSTAARRIALVHGDASPKNILHGPGGPVLLDAECAWYGDPAFDLAFCSAHLLLKTVWKPPHSPRYLAAQAALRDAYLAGVSWEPPGELEARAARLAAAILLARVDGKSPAEYLREDADRAFVRDTARALVAADVDSLDGLAAGWRRALEAR